MPAPTLGDLFKLLDDWRDLPAYRMEPRVDAFAALFLRTLLEQKAQTQLQAHVIPEFPLRRGTLLGETVPSRNKSKKVDFAYCSLDRSVVHLVEFKTDSASRNVVQDDYLEKSGKLTFAQLLKGVMEIAAVSESKYQPKYAALARHLNRWGFGSDAESQALASEAKVRVWYVQPAPGGQDVICFSELSKHIATHDGDLAATIAPYFQKWINGPHSDA